MQRKTIGPSTQQSIRKKYYIIQIKIIWLPTSTSLQYRIHPKQLAVYGLNIGRS